MYKNHRYKSIFCQIDQERQTSIEHLSSEYMNLLAIVFGDQILSGQTPLRQYWDMTMADLQAELLIRTKVNNARANKLEIQVETKQREAEEQFMAELQGSF